VRLSDQVRRATGGLTLIELVVVMAVLAVAAVLVAPAVRRGSEGLRVRAGARQVAALLREARSQAVAHRRPTRVALERVKRAVTLAWDGDPEPMRRVDLSAGIRLEPAGGADALTFSPRGLARDARWIVEGPGRRRLAIEVHGVTGRVTVAPVAGS
jgi:general secretion pathway protein H